MLTVLEVFVAATITALATGLGVLPFYFRRLSERIVGSANAVAAGLMIAASFQLLIEGASYSIPSTVFGGVLGYLAMVGIGGILRRHSLPNLATMGQLDSKRAILVVVVMTLHSFSEGIGVGVSFGGGEGLGMFVTLVIAIHNIPEGLAIALILIPRGVPLIATTAWAVVSSLPQPLMAVPSYLFVAFFAVLLPWGLGFAAGAMIWMVQSEIIPEALKSLPWQRMIGIVIATIAVVAPFQYLL